MTSEENTVSIPFWRRLLHWFRGLFSNEIRDLTSFEFDQKKTIELLKIRLSEFEDTLVIRDREIRGLKTDIEIVHNANRIANENIQNMQMALGRERERIRAEITALRGVSGPEQ